MTSSATKFAPQSPDAGQVPTARAGNTSTNTVATVEVRRPMRPAQRTLTVASLLIALAASLAAGQDAASQRMRLLRGEAPVEALAAALDADDALVARTAARLLPSKGAPAIAPLGRALRHRDMLVRRNAAMNLGALGAEALELIERALRDDSELVRQGAVFALMGMEQSVEVAALIESAGSDESPLVQRTAVMASRASYQTAETIRLPKEGWRFRTDVDDVGRDERWFAVDLDDSAWDTIAIEEFWGEKGPDPGVGWYRRTIALPDREPPTRAQLDFQAVDESTWVWVNGEFAGSHDIGPTGWSVPFRIDVTGMLNWGGENQITVRVLNSAMAGGIYKPVSIILLEPAE